MKEKKDRKKLFIGVALMMFAVAVSAGTYAYYQTTISGSVTGTILAWNCTNTGTESGNIALGNLKPGSNNSFNFKLTSTNFKTDMSVEVSYADGTQSNAPARMKWYKTTASTTAYVATSNELTFNGDTYVTACSWTNVAAGTTKECYIYYKWPYEDGVDTPSSTNKTLTINYRYTCTQKQD